MPRKATKHETIFGKANTGARYLAVDGALAVISPSYSPERSGINVLYSDSITKQTGSRLTAC
jgi:hypothetical protein